MKILFAALLFALVLPGFSTNSVASAGGLDHKERGVVTFTEPVQLLNVTLRGEYLFVHDDAARARGETCTFVYKGAIESKENLVMSFHCKRELREKASHFTVRTQQGPTGLKEIKEVQFAGSIEAHLVATHPSHTVPIVCY